MSTPRLASFLKSGPPASMLSHIKLAALRMLKGAGIFELVADSRWRQQRLLILCYHGTSLADEHLWRPGLYMDPTTFGQRLEILKRGRYPVLPLVEGLQRLQHGTLPSRSVVITFDDGTYDFYKQAFPRLKSYGFPVTVYQTTYYTDFERPVCSTSGEISEGRLRINSRDANVSADERARVAGGRARRS